MTQQIFEHISFCLYVQLFVNAVVCFCSVFLFFFDEITSVKFSFLNIDPTT